MRFYNTATRQIEQFQPISSGEVKLYTCGPTVYDYAQLGNLRAFVFDDTLRRILAANGLNVRHVMNITDVGHLASDEDEGEDKLEKGANREDKTVWQVADFYIEAFLKDADSLNILEPNAYHGPHGPYARATDFAAEQIALVQRLIDKGYAYQTEQAIYFDVSKLDDYGKLTGQKLSEKEVGARTDVVTDSQKNHPQDFALWFFTVGRFANHSMRWPAPFGEGFPGWHLECSAIIHATLGEPIDIHTGGVDHIGTHHTNEIAQTEAAYDTKLANLWLHNEHLLVDGQKMSKSKGNFVTLNDILEKGIDPLALRLLFLQSHYRSQTSFSWDSLAAAAKYLAELRSLADLRFQVTQTAQKLDNGYFSNLREAILSALSDDLATPAALARLQAAVSEITSRGLNLEDLGEFTDFIKFLNDVLGLDLLASKDIDGQQRGLIESREKARKDSDWKKADELRDQLLGQGIEINDTPAGPLWRRS